MLRAIKPAPRSPAPIIIITFVPFERLPARLFDERFSCVTNVLGNA